MWCFFCRIFLLLPSQFYAPLIGNYTALHPNWNLTRSENCNSAFPDVTQEIIVNILNIHVIYFKSGIYYKMFHSFLQEAGMPQKIFKSLCQINNINKCSVHFDTNNWKQYQNNNASMIQVTFNRHKYNRNNWKPQK